MNIRILYLPFLCSIQSLGIKPEPHVNLFHNDSCSYRNTYQDIFQDNGGLNIPDDIFRQLFS